MTTLTKQQVKREALQNPVGALQAQGGLTLREFIEFFWPEVSSDEFKGNWHIDLLCDELTALAECVARKKPKLHDLIINVPPGTTKTVTCSIMFPVWCWTHWPWMQFICASYSAALALESAEKSRDIVRSDRFKFLYTTTNQEEYDMVEEELDIKADKDQKSNFRLVKRVWTRPGVKPRIIRGGNRFSTSVGGTLTGYHGHILIVDDPLDPNKAVSEKERETANYWMNQTLSMRKTDKAIVPTVLIMQRLHQDDPTGHWLAKKKLNVRHISLPGEIRNFRDRVQPAEFVDRYKGELLDPVRMPWEVMEDAEADLGQYGYAGQMGQNPTPPGGGMFKVKHMSTSDREYSKGNIFHTVRYWDKAGTADAGAFTVGVKMAKLKNGKFVIQDVVRGQWASEEREAIIKHTAEADGVDVQVGVEQEPGSSGKEAALSTVRNLSGFSVHRDAPTGDKVYRADTFSVQVNNYNVMIKDAPWNHEYVEELRYFPFGKYKDQVDASSGAFNMLTKRRKVQSLYK